MARISLLFKHLKIEGDLGSDELEALFDTGATYSFIRQSVAQGVATILPIPRPKSFELAETRSLSEKYESKHKQQRIQNSVSRRRDFSLRGKVLEAKERITIDIIVNGITISDEVVVIEDLFEELILGASTMQKWRIKLDLERGNVIIAPRAVRLKLV